MMLIVWAIANRKNHQSPITNLQSIHRIGVIALISLFLIISDNVYMLALRDPDSLIAVVSTIRRGGAVIGFAYGLIFLKEPDPWRKVLCMVGILAGLICLAIGSMG
jgi:transporter family protein